MALVPTIDPHRYSKNPGGKFVTDEVALFFENAGLMTPPENNKRRVSTTILSSQTDLSTPPSPSSSSSSSSSSETLSSASFPVSYTNIPQDEIEVPEYLNSIQTYELIGFNHDIACDMWSRYITGYPDDPKGDFMDYARAKINCSHRVPRGLSTSEDWGRIMDSLGINGILQAAILSPGFDDIRGTASCKHWVSQAVEMRFEALEQLMDYLSNEYERRRGIKQAENREDSALSPPAANTTTEAPASLDGHTMLWHACSKPAADFCTSSWCLELSKLGTYPGDFGGRCRTYFTPQWQTANRFAMYFKHIAPLAEMALLQIAVPDDFLARLSKCILFSEGDSSETWKKLVWSVRGGKLLKGDLRDLRKRDLSTAHMFVSGSVGFDVADGYAALRSSNALMVEVNGERRKAEQWSFSLRGSEDESTEVCKEKCWVHAVGRLVRAST